MAGVFMQYSHVLLLAAIVAVMLLSRVARAKWIPIVIAAGFLSVQFVALGVWLDAEARRVLVSEIQAGRSLQHVGNVNVAVKHAQMPVRVTAILAGIGLFVTVCCWAPRRTSG